MKKLYKRVYKSWKAKSVLSAAGFAIAILVIFAYGCLPFRSMQVPRVFTTVAGYATPIEYEFEIPEPTDYIIGIDDTLEIDIWKHPDLSKEVKVRPDGKISYLLIGDIQAAGLTVAELDDELTMEFEIYAQELKENEVIDAPPLRQEYRIGLADELNISVWKNPDLSTNVIVRPDGKISFPLTGDIQAHKKTLTELDEELTRQLSEYVREPQVSIMITKFGEVERKRITFVTDFISTFLEERPEISVIVKSFGSRKVIVLGQVSTPGIYDIKGAARLLDAIAYAGGFTDQAVKDNIFLIRGDIDEEPTVIKANAWDIIKRGNQTMNIPLENRDIIYAPRSIVGNINVFISQIRPAVDLLNESVILKDAIESTFEVGDWED